MHYYQFNIADWALHTSHLSIEEEAVYLRLLNHYYDTEQPIPKKTQPVLRRLRLGNHSDIAELILEEFFYLDGDFWRHKRVDRELEAFKARAERAKENGKKGGRPSKQAKSENTKPKKTQQVISGNPDETQAKANQEPITNNQEPIDKTPCPPPADSVTDLFVEFWSVYPRKTKRADAEKAFRKLKPDRALTETLIDDIGRRLVAGAWIADGDERQFIPHPTTYLNGKRWNDEIIPRQGVPNGSHQPGYQPRKLTPAERTEQARQAALRRDATGQSSDLGAMETHGGNVRPLLGQSTR